MSMPSSKNTSSSSSSISKASLLPIAIHEMHTLTGRPGRLSLLRRFIALLALCLLVIFLVESYQNRGESSYLDLVLDSLIQDLSETTTEDGSLSQSSHSGDADGSIIYCRDRQGWIAEWLSTGSMPKCSLADRTKVDVLYTWVNGSEPLYQKEKKYWQDKSPVFGGSGVSHDRKIRVTERRHREHDELRYSVRSVFKYFKHGFNRIRILASDFKEGETWIGQVPHWLDLDLAKQHNLSMIYTSELYGAQKSDLPVFNSLALESQFRNVPTDDAQNDVMVYMNDDMFLASEHSVSDFWNPIMGMNIQVDSRSWVENEDATVQDFQWDWNSEWTALRYSNFLLSQRFGWRRRCYVAHFSKPLSRTILTELQTDFGNETIETSKHRFRSEGKDVNTVFLHTHYIMERHREMLLESYILHRADANGDGALDMEERRVLVDQLIAAQSHKFVRKTIEDQLKAMKSAGLPPPKVSKPVWASTDGYPFALNTPTSDEDTFNKPAPPTFGTWDAPHSRNPGFDFIDHCLTNEFTSEHLADLKVDANVLFKILARDYPYCGDMLLSILIPQSNTGLHHILPSPSHPKYSYVAEQLHKYAYTISETTSEFIMAKSAETLKKGFTRVLRLMRNHIVAQFCVNDDVESIDKTTVQKMDLTFKGLLQGYYGGLTEDRGRSPVERVDTVEDVNGPGVEYWNAESRKGGPGYDKGS